MDYDKILSRRAVALKPSGIRRLFRHRGRDGRRDLAGGGGTGLLDTPGSIRQRGHRVPGSADTPGTPRIPASRPCAKEIANYLQAAGSPLQYDREDGGAGDGGRVRRRSTCAIRALGRGRALEVHRGGAPASSATTPLTAHDAAARSGARSPTKAGGRVPADGRGAARGDHAENEAARCCPSPTTRPERDHAAGASGGGRGGAARHRHHGAVGRDLRRADLRRASGTCRSRRSARTPRSARSSSTAFPRAYAMTGWRLGYAGGPGAGDGPD